MTETHYERRIDIDIENDVTASDESADVLDTGALWRQVIGMVVGAIFGSLAVYEWCSVGGTLAGILGTVFAVAGVVLIVRAGREL